MLYQLKKKFFKRKFSSSLANPEKLGALLPEDIFIVSYPKSGSTWLRFLIGNYLTGNKCDFTNYHLIVPDIHQTKVYEQILSHPRFFKSHHTFTAEYRNVVYIVRDARDVAVSYFHHLKKYRKIEISVQFAEYLTDFNSGKVTTFGRWSDHIMSWTDNIVNKFLLIHYEDIKMNPCLQLERIMSFAGIPIHEERIRMSAEFSEFHRMKEAEKLQRSLCTTLSDSDYRIDFVRKGQVGEWKEYFTEEMLDEFMKVHWKAYKRIAEMREIANLDS